MTATDDLGRQAIAYSAVYAERNDLELVISLFCR